MDEWSELDQLLEELRTANETWAKSAEAVQQQVESFRPLSEQVDRHFDELDVYEALLKLGGRVLSDAARIHLTRLHFGLVRSAAIVWSPLDDPRAHLTTAPPQGQYSLEIRVGPRYLLGVERDAGMASDQRLSILIAGEKQMVAVLPTSPDRFRAALLRAFQAPHYTGPSREPEAEASAEGTATEAAATAAPDEAAATGQAESDRVETNAEAPAPSSAEERAPKRRRARAKKNGATEPAPPIGDEPIPMPAAPGPTRD